MTARPPVSIVIPLLDEEGSVVEQHARLRATLPERSEIVFVDDGSTDGTAVILREIARDDPDVVVVRLRRNFGKSIALAAGFRRARGEVLAMMDGDLQERPEDVPRLVEHLEQGYDLVSGWRRHRRDPLPKVWASRVFNLVVSLLGGLRVRDVNCGFKVFRREVADEIDLAPGFHRYIPLLAHWRGFRTTELEVAHGPRAHGRSRYGGERVFSGLLDLVVILFLTRYESRPGRWLVAFGAAMGVIGFVLCAHLAYLWFESGSIQSKFPRLALGLGLMVVGLQTASMGLLGELLAFRHRARGREVDDPVAEVLRGRDAADRTADGTAGEESDE
jgi:glycosyltransferase involved in cell wall biosynthesis